MRLLTSMKTAPQQIIIFLVIGGAINLLFLGGAFQRLESITLDKRIAYYRSAKEIPANIVTVMIDEESLQDMAPEFGRFPWPRGVYADLIDFFSMGGAKAVLFDILFTENERAATGRLSEGDGMLAAASGECGIAFHSAQIIVDKKDEFGAGSLNRPLPDDFQAKFAIAAKGCRTGRLYIYHHRRPASDG